VAHDNNAIITAFVKEFDAEAPAAERIGAYFTEDALYHNIPMQPISGRQNIQNALGGMAATMKSRGWEVKHQVANGDVVMNERVDRFHMGGKDVSIAVMGVFVLREGKIAEWRDYFDLGMWQAQMK
jgi:limonene-1,2-epoxide hydrolase